MAEILLARDRLSDERVVVKRVLRAEAGEENRLVLNEFTILSTLTHPSLPRVLGFGESAEGRNFLVQERLEPVDWPSLTGERKRSLLLRMSFQLLDLLDYLHFHRYVHLDIKPENILLAPGDGIDCYKLIDFGLATAIPAPAHWGEMTGTGPFVAPEIIIVRTIKMSISENRALSPLTFDPNKIISLMIWPYFSLKRLVNSKTAFCSICVRKDEPVGFFPLIFIIRFL